MYVMCAHTHIPSLSNLLFLYYIIYMQSEWKMNETEREIWIMRINDEKKHERKEKKELSPRMICATMQLGIDYWDYL